MDTRTARVGLMYDPMFRFHETGSHHIECPERLGVIMDELERAGLAHQLVPVQARRATDDELAMVHDPAYIHLLRLMCDEGFNFIGTRDTQICPASYDVAAFAAGGVMAACDAVMAGQLDRVFCAARPPGHHAEYDQAMGFCLVNHVAIAAEYLVRQYELQRVAIVDFDVHHGNGTQHFFERRSDVMYISLHERPGSIGFPGTGEAHETGIGEGRGATLNVLFNRASGENEYRAALTDQVAPALDAFQPQFLLLSAGFDALMWDRVSHISLPPTAFQTITDLLVRAADQWAEGRVVSVLEGGYDLAHLGQAVAAHVRALLGRAG